MQNMKTPSTLNKGNQMKWILCFSLFTLLAVSSVPRAYAWTWDDDESGAKDELDIQVEGYRKRVEQGISLQERIVLLDRLIKLYKVRNRDSKPLEQERSEVLADEQAVQNVSAAARQNLRPSFSRPLISSSREISNRRMTPSWKPSA